MPKIECKSEDCKVLVRIPTNRSKTATGYCRKCYTKRPETIKKNKENLKGKDEKGQQGRTIKEMKEEWKVIRKRKQVMIEIEESITEHQAFIYSIMYNRLAEIEEDFKRKAFTYWKLHEVMNFLDTEAKKYGYNKGSNKQKEIVKS